MLSIWWQASRPKTLLSSISPVTLGALSALPISNLNIAIFITTLFCALSLQVAVNFANDYFDAKSGVDTDRRLGPVRAVQAGLIPESKMKTALILMTCLAIASGLFLVYQGGWFFLLLGGLSVLGVFLYSAGPAPIASAGLGEVVVFIFFGLIALLGSHYLQSNTITPYAWIFAINTGLFASAVMLANNIRDIPTDRAANKLTLACRVGDPRSRNLLISFITLPFIIHCLLTPISMLMVLPLMICLVPAILIVKNTKIYDGRQLNKLLGQIATLNFIYCVSSSVFWQLHLSQ